MSLARYREVKYPRRWFLGMRVVGVRHPSGRDYAALRTWDPQSRYPEPKEYLAYRKAVNVMYHSSARLFPGVLIKSEWGCPAFVNTRYTIRCDDGVVRKFQQIRPE